LSRQFRLSERIARCQHWDMSVRDSRRVPVKAKWIIAGFGIVVAGGYLWYDYAQEPTIRFIGYQPRFGIPPRRDLRPGEFGYEPVINAATFAIHNDTRHPFSTWGDNTEYKVFTESTFRETSFAMNCTGRKFHTIFPGQTVQFQPSAPEMKTGERFAVGIRFYRGTAENLSAPSSRFVETISSWLSERFGRTNSKRKITWSDAADWKP